MNGITIIDHRLTPPVIQLIFSPQGISLQESVQRETATYFLFDIHNNHRTSSFKVFGPLDKLDLAHDKMVESLLTLHENKQLDIISTRVTKKHVEEEILYEIVCTCSICLCDVDDGYRLVNCNHEFCRSCLVQQCEQGIRNPENGFPIRCAHEGCGALILVKDLTSLLGTEKLDELFRASIRLFVASSGGEYRFCPSPDCPSVYKVAENMSLFTCGACSQETCAHCHLEYHRSVSCETYKEFKRDPDLSIKEWVKGKELIVKQCPACMFTIEKVGGGCSHMECRCGTHFCWLCLQYFKDPMQCFHHMRSHYSKTLPFVSS